jgi:hypothetical protein
LPFEAGNFSPLASSPPKEDDPQTFNLQPIL